MLASLTGLLLTLGGEGPAIVFIPPLDPELFDWNPDELSLRFVGEIQGGIAGYQYTKAGVQQSMVVLRPVVYLDPNAPDANGGNCVDLSMGQIISVNDYQPLGTAIYPRVNDVDEIFFGSSESCTEAVVRFIELEDLLQSTSRVDEMLDRLVSLEQKVETLEQSLETCQCASDLDGDGAVGFTDLVELISVWGPCSA